MRRRKYLGIVGGSSLATVAGCTELTSDPQRTSSPSGNNSTENSHTPDEATPTEEHTPAPCAEPGIVIREYDGKQSTITEPFETPNIGFYFNIRYSGLGEKGFSAHLTDPDGEHEDQLLVTVPHRFVKSTIAGEFPDADRWALKIECDDLRESEIDRPGWHVTVWRPKIYLL